jgi:hypothetical protein
MIDCEKGRGLLIYIKSNLCYDMITPKIKFDEYLLMQINMDNGNSFVLASIYLSPDSSMKNNMDLNKMLNFI